MNRLKVAICKCGSYLQREWEKAARTDAAIAEARAKAYENRLPRYPM